MSNHSIIEHRAAYHFVKIEEDYLAICSDGKTSPHCKALILSILEQWTNTKLAKGEGQYVRMTMPQWIKQTYMLYERNVITSCIQELLEEKFIERRQIKVNDQNTFEYKLCIEKIQALLKKLPQKDPKDYMPNLDAYLQFKENGKKQRAERKEKGVGEKSRTSKRVREKSTTVGEKPTEGYVNNQSFITSNTQLHNITSKRELATWYTFFDGLYRKKDGYAPSFKVPRSEKTDNAISGLIEAGATFEQVEFVFDDIWNDPDLFWKQNRTITAVASQFAARVGKMQQSTNSKSEEDVQREQEEKLAQYRQQMAARKAQQKGSVA